VERRKALKSLGWGVSAGLFMPQLLMSCKKESTGPEVKYSGSVAVIGAGAAGLYAADILRSKGIKVTVLEASAILGGRIKSFRSTTQPSSSLFFDPTNPSIADFPLELGGDVVYGSNSIWGSIMSDLVVSTYDLSGSTNQFILDNNAQSGATWGADADYNAVQNFIAGLPNYSGSGVSVQDASGVSTRGQALLNSEAGNFYGSSSQTIDAGALGQGLKLHGMEVPKPDGKQLILKANLMQDVLASRFSQVASEVTFNTPIQSIDYSGSVVVMTTKSGQQIQADKVIVTIPISILKNGGITFNPGLPAAMASSMSRIGMDDCVRVLLDFKKNFWGVDTGFIWGGTTVPQYFNGGVGRSQNYSTLCMNIFGSQAAELSAMGPDMVTPILSELDAVYAGQASEYILRNLNTDAMPALYTIQDWSKEEFIQGGISYPMVGATNNDRVAIGQPINNMVFFAGEATDVNGDGGTINGAMASAERVATQVVQSITNP
jgi:monoamine oxidase